MFVGESTEAASTAIRATSRSKAWLVRYGGFCRGTLSGCLAIKDVSAKPCTMNTYTKWWGGGIKSRVAARRRLRTGVEVPSGTTEISPGRKPWERAR